MVLTDRSQSDADFNAITRIMHAQRNGMRPNETRCHSSIIFNASDIIGKGPVDHRPSWTGALPSDIKAPTAGRGARGGALGWMWPVGAECSMSQKERLGKGISGYGRKVKWVWMALASPRFLPRLGSCLVWGSITSAACSYTYHLTRGLFCKSRLANP